MLHFQHTIKIKSLEKLNIQNIFFFNQTNSQICNNNDIFTIEYANTYSLKLH